MPSIGCRSRSQFCRVGISRRPKLCILGLAAASTFSGQEQSGTYVRTRRSITGAHFSTDQAAVCGVAIYLGIQVLGDAVWCALGLSDQLSGHNGGIC